MTKAVLQARLSDAEAAYHNLMMGTSVREYVDQNGERIAYTPATASRLAAYIHDLKRQLGLLTVKGPMRAWF